MGWLKNRNFLVTYDALLGGLGPSSGDHLVTMGAHGEPCSSSEAHLLGLFAGNISPYVWMYRWCIAPRGRPAEGKRIFGRLQRPTC